MYNAEIALCTPKCTCLVPDHYCSSGASMVVWEVGSAIKSNSTSGTGEICEETEVVPCDPCEVGIESSITI